MELRNSSTILQTKNIHLDYYFTGTHIGVGMNGPVIYAINIKTNVACAIKTLNIDTSECALGDYIIHKKLYELEINGICQIYGVYKNNNIIYIIMKKYKMDLYDYIISDKNNIKTTFDIFEKIAKIMIDIHNNDYVHYDIKPENILLDDNYDPFVTDFGFTKHISDKCIPQGTSSYTAPEIFTSEIINKSSDVWAYTVMFAGAISQHNLFKKQKFSQKSIDKSRSVLPIADQYKSHDSIIFINNLFDNTLLYDDSKRISFEQIYDMFINHKKR